MSEAYDPENYKIYSLLDNTYTSNAINTIDFKRHLKPTISLDKVVLKDASGRPSTTEYYYNSDLIAIIYFTFTMDADNLLTGRSETLHYIMLDSTEGEPILIKSKTYNLMNAADLEEIVNERVRARSSIVAGLKGFISGVIQQYGYTQAQSLDMGVGLWDLHTLEISNFLEFGTELWKTELIALDTSTTYSWLELPIDGNGTTIRDYLVSRLTY